MKTPVLFLCVVALAAAVPAVRADTGGRVIEVDGDVTFVAPGSDDSRGATAGLELEDGVVVSAAEGARVRVSIPGVGEITLTGPASVRLDHTDGVATVTLLSGAADFDYEGGDVRLAVEGGTLHVAGVNGRTADLAGGTNLGIEGGAAGPRVRVRSGSALFSGVREHVLLRAGEAREFGGRRDGPGWVRLSGQGLDLQLPTEVLLEPDAGDHPALRELEDAWNRNRESPRIP